MEAHLSGHHRDTVERIFAHPTSHNIRWREVVSLLETIGTVTHEHNGKLRVSLGPETEVLPAPHGKDVGIQVVSSLRWSASCRSSDQVAEDGDDEKALAEPDDRGEHRRRG